MRSPNQNSDMVMVGSRPGENDNNLKLDDEKCEADLSLSSIDIIDEPITNLAMFDRMNGGSSEIRSVIKRSINNTGHSSMHQSF